jgi:DNA-binding transcriptional MerR regulator
VRPAGGSKLTSLLASPILAPQGVDPAKVAESSSSFSVEQVAGLLGLTLGQIRSYVRSGVIEPDRGPRGELRFSFQDLVFLRVVRGLSTARVPPRRVRQAIRRLREQLPEGRPLSGVRLSAFGGQVVAREDDRVWSPDSGQYWLDFDAPARGAETRPLPGRGADVEGPVELTASSEGWYALGAEIEESDPAQARAAYVRALELDPGHADAHINLGCLEHEAGRLPEAERHYRVALTVRPGDAVAAFDLGVVLEDLGRLDEARGAYEQALAADPGSADAHYNLARLHDRLGDPAAAIRHLLAYRKLTQC